MHRPRQHLTNRQLHPQFAHHQEGQPVRTHHVITVRCADRACGVFQLGCFLSTVHCKWPITPALWYNLLLYSLFLLLDRLVLLLLAGSSAPRAANLSTEQRNTNFSTSKLADLYTAAQHTYSFLSMHIPRVQVPLNTPGPDTVTLRQGTSTGAKGHVVGMRS